MIRLVIIRLRVGWCWCGRRFSRNFDCFASLGVSFERGAAEIRYRFQDFFIVTIGNILVPATKRLPNYFKIEFVGF